MKNSVKGLIVLPCVLLLSCTKVVVVDLKTAEPKLVVDASIDWVKGTPGHEQQIKLSTTTGYYSTAFPGVSGADIMITNEAHTVFRFAESPEAGTYTCSGFLPVIGETYTLNIVVNGAHYTASETCIGVPDIGNNIVQNNAGGFGGDEVEISYSYQDKDNEDNYYLQGISTPVAAYPEYKPEDDKKSQGKLMQQYFSDKNLNAGDLVKIRLYGISRRYYDYFRKLLTASGAESGPFQSIPGAVTGNIINQTHSANLAYGYFRVSEVAVKEYTIQ